MDYSKITLGELLSSDNEAIRRNATGILKQIQKRKLNPDDIIFYKVIGNPPNGDSIILGYTKDRNAFEKEMTKTGWKKEWLEFEKKIA